MGSKSTEAERVIRESIKRLYPRTSVMMKMHADQFTEKGWPDLCGVINGRAIHIEVKVQPDSPSSEQVHKLQLLREAGAFAAIAMFYRDGKVAFLLENFDKFTWRVGKLDMWFPSPMPVVLPGGKTEQLINLRGIHEQGNKVTDRS